MTTPTTDTDSEKKIEIALSDRAPVRIVATEWPIVSRASWFSGAHECQANEVAWLKVRMHCDGRVLVYGCRDRGPGGKPIEYRGASAGFLLAGEEGFRLLPGTNTQIRIVRSPEIVRTIRRVVGVLGHDLDCLADEAISDLPAEDL
jgi:hypothetical protein